jgi:deoxyribonuclease V
MPAWPRTATELIARQHELAAMPSNTVLLGDVSTARSVGGCFVCFERGGSGPGDAGDRGWAGAALLGVRTDTALASGTAGAAYAPGLLALREGPLLEAAVRRLRALPDVLLVNATGRDHPRRAGLALHLGAVLGIPTVGVTHRTLVATGEWPEDEHGATSPLALDGEQVGCWVRTRPGTRPLAVHAAWRTDVAGAVEVVLAATRRTRTPEPIRRARQAARLARDGPAVS